MNLSLSKDAFSNSGCRSHPQLSRLTREHQGMSNIPKHDNLDTRPVPFGFQSPPLGQSRRGHMPMLPRPVAWPHFDGFGWTLSKSLGLVVAWAWAWAWAGASYVTKPPQHLPRSQDRPAAHLGQCEGSGLGAVSPPCSSQEPGRGRQSGQFKEPHKLPTQGLSCDSECRAWRQGGQPRKTIQNNRPPSKRNCKVCRGRIVEAPTDQLWKV